MFKIAGRVRLNLMLLQEGIEFPARRDSEEDAELVGGEAALAVKLRGRWLRGRRGRVLASEREGGGQLIGDIERDLHGTGLTNTAGRDRRADCGYDLWGLPAISHPRRCREVISLAVKRQRLHEGGAEECQSVPFFSRRDGRAGWLDAYVN